MGAVVCSAAACASARMGNDKTARLRRGAKRPLFHGPLCRFSSCGTLEGGSSRCGTVRLSAMDSRGAVDVEERRRRRRRRRRRGRRRREKENRTFLLLPLSLRLLRLYAAHTHTHIHTQQCCCGAINAANVARLHRQTRCAVHRAFTACGSFHTPPCLRRHRTAPASGSPLLRRLSPAAAASQPRTYCVTGFLPRTRSPCGSAMLCCWPSGCSVTLKRARRPTSAAAALAVWASAPYTSVLCRSSAAVCDRVRRAGGPNSDALMVALGSPGRLLSGPLQPHRPRV